MKIGDTVKVLSSPFYTSIQKQRVEQVGRIILIDTVNKSLRYQVLFDDERSVTFFEKEIEISTD